MQIQLTNGKFVEIREPVRGDFPAKLRGSVEFLLAHFLYKVMEIMGHSLGIFMGSVFVSALEIIEPEMLDHTSPLLDEVLSWPDLPPNIRTFFEGLRFPSDPAAAALLGGLGSTAGSAVVGSVLSSLLAPVTYGLNDLIRPARPNPAEGATMLWRGGIEMVTFMDFMADHGWPATVIDAFLDILKPRLAVPDLIALSFRRTGSPDGFTDELHRRGWTDTELADLYEISRLVPGPNDLVRFAVREAWRDDVASKWGYDQDFVPQFQEWMEKQGMGGEWPKLYWRAHWDLPSLTMAREMVHRTDYTVDDFKDLLRIADIPAGYRDYLAEIIFAPYTRVDIRRMYRTGTLKEGDLTTSYMDIGYDQDKALKLAEFTIREYGEEEREATKGDVISAYTDDLMNFGRASELLDALDYPEWLIGIYLARADIKKSKTLQNERIRQIRTGYVNYDIDQTGAHSELGKLNLPAIRIERLVEEWNITRDAKLARPSVSKLESYFFDNIITQDQFTEQMDFRKYGEPYLRWAIEDVLLRKREAAQKEGERTKKERERLRVTEIKTARDEVLAELDVEIAEWKVTIADLQLASLSMDVMEELEAIKETIVAIKLEIAILNQLKAEERLSYIEEKGVKK